ncbi:MAG: AAA family ATPase, partial [Thermodesulfobacteriota bacterium]
HGTDPDGPSRDLTARFAALTEGLANFELMSLVHLSRQESIEIQNIENLCHRYKYGVKESEWDKLDGARLAGAENHLRSRIKGQEEAIARVLDIVKRARIGLAAGAGATSSRPRGVLFFAGPTGVGKTEMAKSLAEMLFGEEERCIRFDMSEYSAPQSDEKLLGAPPGYVGYEEGGQLTNAMKEKPFSILLFDEIEKAHGRIFDKFLQILDDGRLTDGKGDTVYFSESIIIFTSNLGTVSREESPEGRRALVTPDMPFAQMKEKILSAIRDHFNYVLGRPEVLNRFGDNFVVFNFIKPPVDQEIVDLMISRLAKSVTAKWKIGLELGPEVRERLTALARGQLHHGGRGVRNMVDSALVNPLTRFLFDLGAPEALAGADRIRITGLEDRGPDAPYRFVVQGEIVQ